MRGKQNADVEFGAKVEVSVVNGYLRVEDMRRDAFNEGTTLQASAESYRAFHGHYPKRILADTILRTREKLQYSKSHGIHLNGPKLGKSPTDPALRREQRKQEWLESGERGEIERDFGVGKSGCIVTKPQHTSEAAVRVRKLRLLLRLFRERLNRPRLRRRMWRPVLLRVLCS